jgi:hypothetical protein
MLRFLWFVVLVMLASVAGPGARAEPQVSIAPVLPVSAYSTPVQACDGFAEDELRLIVSVQGAQVVKRDFCSSYGHASARAVTDKAGQIFILLEYGEGRGTNAVTNYLELLRLHPDFLEVLRVPLAWGTGPTQRFAYSYSLEFPAAGGMRIHLKGQMQGTPDPGFECCVPPADHLTIDVSN